MPADPTKTEARPVARHTPGPWRAEEHGLRLQVWTVEGMKIAEICGLAGFDYANARLIAAAPDLLAALEGARDWIVEAVREAVPPFDPTRHVRVVAIDALLARVKGTAS